VFKNTSLLVAVVIAVISAFVLNWLNFFEAEYRTIENWAYFGTYIGGVLGVLFGGITLVMVIRTYHANRQVIENMSEQLNDNKKVITKMDEQLGLYSEEMSLMRAEAERSRGEAKKSADAATALALVTERQATIEQLIKSVESYENSLQKLFQKKRFIDREVWEMNLKQPRGNDVSYSIEWLLDVNFDFDSSAFRAYFRMHLNGELTTNLTMDMTEIRDAFEECLIAFSMMISAQIVSPLLNHHKRRLMNKIEACSSLNLVDGESLRQQHDSLFI
jgi:uncharacterized coiled-coil protein SlyX